MSFSFTIKEASKDLVGEHTDGQLDIVVNGQPLHEIDRQAIQDTVEAYVDMLRDPEEGEEITLSVAGTIMTDDDGGVTSVGMNISATVTVAEEVKAGDVVADADKAE